MRTLSRGVGIGATLLFVNFYINPYPLVGIILYAVLTLIAACVEYVPLARELQRTTRRGRSGYIYAFMDVGNIIPAVKIGRETTKGQRLNAHRTAAPLGIIVLCSFRVKDAVAAEKYLHRRYKDYRLNPRNEWFMLTPHVITELMLLRVLKR